METPVIFTPEELDFSGSVWRTDDGFVTSSVMIAKIFGKQHKDVLEAIRDRIRLAENSADLCTNYLYKESFYIDDWNRKQFMYILNQNSFSEVALAFTGDKAFVYRRRYINQFEKMRKGEVALDFSDRNFVKRCLLELDKMQEENDQLKLERKENAPFTELGKIVSEKSGGSTMSDVAKEAGIKGITRDYLLAVLVKEGVAKRTPTGYIKVYGDHAKDFVDARLYQRERPTGVGFRTYLKATELGKGWLIDVAKEFLTYGFKPEGRKRRVK